MANADNLSHTFSIDFRIHTIEMNRHTQRRLKGLFMCTFLVATIAFCGVHGMDDLHDENHPAAHEIEGEVVDTGAINAGGEESLQHKEEEDYEKHEDGKKSGMGMLLTHFFNQSHNCI